jgi:benzoyl-CoA reductase subunit B
MLKLGTARYKSEPLRSWEKARELRMQYYRDYVETKEKGGLRWITGAHNFQPLPRGLGDDVHSLTGEPYGASIGANPDFSRECQEAAEAKGFARDLCAYMRSYWGAMFLNKWAVGRRISQAGFCPARPFLLYAWEMVPTGKRIQGNSLLQH